MMFADLIDLDDFSDRLRGLGLEIPAGADAELIERELINWIDEAPQSGRETIAKMLSDLEQESQGLMLPSVAAIVNSARARIE